MGGRGPTAPVQAALIGAGALLTTAYLLLPSTAARVGMWATLGVVSALAILLVTHRAKPQDRLPELAAGRRHRPARRRPRRRAGRPGTPSYADMPRLLAYPVLAGAVTAFQRDRIRHDRDSLLDALVVTVAAAQAGWLVLIEPVLRRLGRRPAQLAHRRRLPARPPARPRRSRPGSASPWSAGATARPACCSPACSPGSPPRLAADIADRPELAAGWLRRLRPGRPGRHAPDDGPAAPGDRRASGWPPPGASSSCSAWPAWSPPCSSLTHPAGDGVSQAAVVLGGAVDAVRPRAAAHHQPARLGCAATLRREHVLRAATGAAGRCRRPRRGPRRRARPPRRPARPAGQPRLADRRRPGRHRRPGHRRRRPRHLPRLRRARRCSREHEQRHRRARRPVAAARHPRRARRPRRSCSSRCRRAVPAREGAVIAVELTPSPRTVVGPAVAGLDDAPGPRAPRRRRDHGRAAQRAPAAADAAVRLRRDLHPRPRPDDRARDAGRGADRRPARPRAARHELARRRRRRPTATRPATWSASRRAAGRPAARSGSTARTATPATSTPSSPRSSTRT